MFNNIAKRQKATTTTTSCIYLFANWVCNNLLLFIYYLLFEGVQSEWGGTSRLARNTVTTCFATEIVFKNRVEDRS